MMTKEEYEQVVALRAQGLTIKEAARRLGYHPATISKWLSLGGPPEARATQSVHRVLDAKWEYRVSQLLVADPRIPGTRVHRILEAEGFPGSYPSVVRHLRAVRGPRLAARNLAPSAKDPRRGEDDETASVPGFADCARS